MAEGSSLPILNKSSAKPANSSSISKNSEPRWKKLANERRTRSAKICKRI